MRSLALIGTIAILLAPQPAHSQQKKAQAPSVLRFGIYAPNTPFASNSQRWSYIKRLAAYVQSSTGIKCEGRAFSSAGAFSANLGRLDFAVVDPVYLTIHRGRFRVLAVATYGGGSRAPWALFARSAATFQDLKGKVLVMARAGGHEATFAEGLLYGEIDVRRFFKRIKVTPDLAAAVSSVRLGKGDAVFAPVSMGAGLHRVLSVGTVPNAAFVLVNPRIPKELVRKVTAAARSMPAAALGAFGGASFSGVRLGRVKYDFVIKRPVLIRLGFKSFLRPVEGTYQKSDLKEEFWIQ